MRDEAFQFSAKRYVDQPMDRKILEMSSSVTRAVVDLTAGGRLASLQIHDVDVLVERSDDPVAWGCYPMVPFAGRVRDGAFRFEGNRYDVPKNFGDHAMHGFGFTSQWTQVADDTIAYEFVDPWPFAGRVEQHFALDQQHLLMTMQVTAYDRQPMVLGWHPWFRKTTSLGAASLQFDPGAMYERGDQPIPTGALIDPTPRPWDDCFTDVTGAPTLSWGSLELTLQSNASHWVVFDEPEHAICVEPQTGPPNAFNLSPIVLDKNEQLTVTLSFEWNMT